MYYELYVDSLFLINFGMNLYLLLLVNQSLFRTATRRRLIQGALMGAICCLVVLAGGVDLRLRMVIGAMLGSVVMIVYTFQVRSMQAFLKVAEKFVIYSVLMGGGMMLLTQNIPWLQNRLGSIWGVLGMGALLYMVAGYCMERRAKSNYQCMVTLIGPKSRLKVRTLVDSGNSLVEPISGKPVSIVDRNVFESLWEEEPYLYRAIPYHSVGKTRGILKGYLLPEMRIETAGITKVCKDVYIAVCEDYITAEEKMILNPGILTEPEERQKRRKRMSQMNKERYGYYYDIKGGSSG